VETIEIRSLNLLSRFELTGGDCKDPYKRYIKLWFEKTKEKGEIFIFLLYNSHDRRKQTRKIMTTIFRVDLISCYQEKIKDCS